MNPNELRADILTKTREFHAANWPAKEFVPGKTPVPYGGRVFDAEEVVSLVDASLDFWLTAGRFAEEFETRFAEYLGLTYALLCNSGSSANLLAISALTSPTLGVRRLKPGDEVITVAAGFPTTAGPILQNGLVPVFVDIDIGTYNAIPALVDEAVGPRTRAILLPHTLGNPFAMGPILEIAKRRDLWLIEDNCDALGSTYEGRLTGTFGDLATASFYPAHHITMGEGGCVLTDRSDLKRVVESFRDWGRDCWCAPGCDNTCGKRFGWQLGDLPSGYDHKYTYSHIGYNLKLTDMQAAIGLAQLRKLPCFIEARKQNWRTLRKGLDPFREFLTLPEATLGSDPSWFGFPITVRPEAPFRRDQLVAFLESRKIATRMLFGGNLLRQPAFKDCPRRVVGDLKHTDAVMKDMFWVGVYPGLSERMLDYTLESFRDFICEKVDSRSASE